MGKAAQSIEEFCDDNGISRAMLYVLLKRGEGPAIMKVGRRSLISAEAAVAWRRAMEKPVANTQPGKA
jgi:predicted DNA-binding transcriptional regulator AlpA